MENLVEIQISSCEGHCEGHIGAILRLALLQARIVFSQIMMNMVIYFQTLILLSVL